MKKYLLLSFCLICSCILNAVTIKTVKVDINMTNLSFPRDAYGQIQIIPGGDTFVFDEGENMPCLPYYPISVYIPGGNQYVDAELRYNQTLVFNNCTLAPAPKSVTTSQLLQDEPSRVSLFDKDVYPKNNMRYVGKSQVGEACILYFKICPFTYDNRSKRLFLLTNIQLDVLLEDVMGVTSEDSDNSYSVDNPMIKDLVLNPEDIYFGGLTVPDASRPLDYLILTNRELAGAFTKLAEWKKQKGVWTEIMTIEDVERIYDGDSPQKKIKQCLFDMYLHRGLKYVLLGGDDTIIPVRYCKSRRRFKDGTDIPTDMYYSCFGQPFDWDANGNGIYGEPSDSIDMLPSIYLSRVPVRTFPDAENFADRIMSYEKMPTPSVWNNKMLMCGHKLENYKNGHSDSELKGDKLYNDHIKALWNGERKKLYDTYNDFGYERVWWGAIQEQLSTGYAFADFIMHGAPWCFAMDNDGHYDTNDASGLTNPGYTIITTNACSTNAFDDSVLGEEYQDPCLSESLIRNANSGVIAYLGCSREGWYYRGLNWEKTLGPSLQYESRFYNNLFSTQYEDKNWGKIVALSKAELIANCESDNELRWVQFGLNPIGDPEMPVYTDTPKTFPKAKVNMAKGKINIDTGVDSCTVCIMSRLDGGQSYYKVLHNVRNANLDYNVDSLSLCISKQNYVPNLIQDAWSYGLISGPPVSGGLIIGAGKDAINGDLSIKYKVGKESKGAKLVISSYDGAESKTYDAPVEESKLDINSSALKKDILTISLFVDSKLADSISFNNK